MSAKECSTSLRSFEGPKAVELTILCRPGGRPDDPAAQADAAYRALAETLSSRAAGFAHLASETLLVRDPTRDLPAILDARARMLDALAAAGDAPLPGFIGQPPTDGAAFVLLANAVVPRKGTDWSARNVRADARCGCAGCVRAGARIMRLGDQTSLHTTTLHGTGDDAYAQALDAFRAGERLLERCGLSFGDVVRAWIQLRAIDRDYDALNAARRDFFAERGIALRPASTGVGGTPFPDGHLVALSLHAVRRARPLDVGRMSTPLLNEAWSYGADFSRGLRVVEANRVTLHVSGTASIDEHGRTVHVGDFSAQAARMLDNIDSLLTGQGAARATLASAVTYLKHARDAEELRRICARRGFDVPCAVVVADLCRPELLCETEVVAVLPPAAAQAYRTKSG